MNNATTAGKPASKVMEYKRAIKACLVEMDRIQRQMDDEQREIERLRAETRAILMELKTS